MLGGDHLPFIPPLKLPQTDTDDLGDILAEKTLSPNRTTPSFSSAIFLNELEFAAQLINLQLAILAEAGPAAKVRSCPDAPALWLSDLCTFLSNRS